MTKFWKILNLLILGILVFITIYGSIISNVFFDWDMETNISYLILYASTFTHLILTVISRKKGAKRHITLSIVFLILTMHVYLKSTLWRCSEYSYEGTFFYLPCRFEKNPCSLSREILLDVHSLDSILRIPKFRDRYKENMKSNYNEPSLINSDIETYRFIWDSSFDGTKVIRIQKTKDSYFVTKKFFSSYEDTIGITTKYQISENKWNGMIDHLVACNFWTYSTSNDRNGLDGAFWTLEGYKPQKDECTLKNYHQVGRWSPIDTTFISMCKLFYKLEMDEDILH